MLGTKIVKALVLVFLLCLLGILLLQFHEQSNKTILEVTFLDVGQGDAIFIEAPNGNQMLIDTGPHKNIMLAIDDVLPFYDRSIDVLMLTHMDSDHIAGTVPLFDAYHIDQLFIPTTTLDKTNETIIAIDAVTLHAQQFLFAGNRIMLDPVRQVYFDIYHPSVGYETDESNDFSIVGKLQYGEVCFVFTGDASQEVELLVVNQYEEQLDCEVLKVGHHGSQTSSSELFVGLVSPDYAVISAGKENKFGHPHQEVLDVLQKMKVAVLQTQEQGSITFLSDGVTVWLDK